jgi:hypothetical protein
MGEFLLEKSKDKKVTGKRMVMAAMGIIAILLIAGTVFLIQGGHGRQQTEEKKEEAYQSLSKSDQETVDLYAELYETEREEVAKIQTETKDWEQTGRELEQAFFTIPENTKYQMAEEGYSLDDLEQAEKLSVKTGRKAIELAKAKGKASENKSWSEVVKDDEILSTEEQMGLSKEQIQQLKDKSLSKEERMEVAILLLNETYTFEEVLEKLDAGETVEELTKEKSK